MNSSDNPQVDLFKRPLFQLRSLPLNFRWEVTRRHSVYQCYWRSFVQFLELPEDIERQTEDIIAQLSFVALVRIGVSGSAPDPSTEFADLDAATFSASWMSGAIHPLTSRSLVSLLLASLPKTTLRDVGTAMINASLEDNDNSEPNQIRELRRLAGANLDGLDNFLDEPIVSINPASSVRQVRAAIEERMVQWKEERGLVEQRTRVDKYNEYLEVWDAREGWSEGRYVRSRESSLRDISTRLGKPLTTIHNQYRSAFQLITGHPYSIFNWLTVFGLIKFTKVFGDRGVGSSHRPINDRTDRAVPDSLLAASEDRLTFTESRSLVGGEDHTVLLNSIKQMIESGSSDDEIVDALDLQYPEIVPGIRDRQIDGLF